MLLNEYRRVWPSQSAAPDRVPGALRFPSSTRLASNLSVSSMLAFPPLSPR